MNKGLFITFEGGEGAGKTTLIAALHERLEQAGRQVITTREPGGIAIAEQIREIILDRHHTAMDARTEALLYAAARCQHFAERIRPALESGKIVLCDRFIDSSLAYQGYARGLGIETVYEINRFAIDSMMPDRTIYLDIDPRIGLERVQSDTDREVNRLDLEKVSFHEQVRLGYIELIDRFPDRIVAVDANRHPDLVAQEVWSILWREIESNRNLSL